MALIFLVKFVQQNVNVTLCPKQRTEVGFASQRNSVDVSGPATVSGIGPK